MPRHPPQTTVCPADKPRERKRSLSCKGGDMDISSIPHVFLPALAPAETPVPRPPSADQHALVQAVKAVNAIELFGQDNELTFFLDRNTHRAVVRIVTRNTRDLR